MKNTVIQVHKIVVLFWKLDFKVRISKILENFKSVFLEIFFSEFQEIKSSQKWSRTFLDRDF